MVIIRYLLKAKEKEAREREHNEDCPIYVTSSNPNPSPKSSFVRSSYTSPSPRGSFRSKQPIQSAYSQAKLRRSSSMRGSRPDRDQQLMTNSAYGSYGSRSQAESQMLSRSVMEPSYSFQPVVRPAAVRVSSADSSSRPS